mgnify:CR=1 FL=1|jgi:hypothetical protein
MKSIVSQLSLLFSSFLEDDDDFSTNTRHTITGKKPVWCFQKQRALSSVELDYT